MSGETRTRPWLLAVAVGALALLALGWMTFPRSTGSDTPDADLVDAVSRDGAAVLWSGENDAVPEPRTTERVRRVVTQLQWNAADVRPLADALRAWTVTPADLDDPTALERKASQAGALVVAVGLEGDIHPALAQATADVMASWLAHLHGAVTLADDGGPSLDVDTGWPAGQPGPVVVGARQWTDPIAGERSVLDALTALTTTDPGIARGLAATYLRWLAPQVATVLRPDGGQMTPARTELTRLNWVAPAERLLRALLPEDEAAAELWRVTTRATYEATDPADLPAVLVDDGAAVPWDRFDAAQQDAVVAWAESQEYPGPAVGGRS